MLDFSASEWRMLNTLCTFQFCASFCEFFLSSSISSSVLPLRRARYWQDKLVDNVPQPRVWQLDLDGLVAVEYKVEQVAVVFKRLEALLERGRELGVDVAVVELLVEHEKHAI